MRKYKDYFIYASAISYYFFFISFQTSWRAVTVISIISAIVCALIWFVLEESHRKGGGDNSRMRSNEVLSQQASQITEEEYRRLKREQSVTRLIGFILLPVSLFLHVIFTNKDMTNLIIPAALAEVAGLVLIIRSFGHSKFRILKYASDENGAQGAKAGKTAAGTTGKAAAAATVKSNSTGKQSDAVSLSEKRTKKTGPDNVVCVKCGVSMVNDGTVNHMGDKYYCRDCYERLREKKTKMKQGRGRSGSGLPICFPCSNCGKEQRRSEVHTVKNRYYCEECFGKLFVSDNGEREAEFDRDAFMKNHKRLIAARVPENIESAEVQRRLINNLAVLIPTVTPADVSDAEIIGMERGTIDKKSAIGRIAFNVNSALDLSEMENITEDWKIFTDEQLIDAYLLLDFYAFLLKSDASSNIAGTLKYVGAELQYRFSQ